ncbi:MAG: hypothetical protein HY744_02690 [Deltaproteobacteria bacterium]|nr:hypothetical protein [Deltaproteobacteria bacterium]
MPAAAALPRPLLGLVAAATVASMLTHARLASACDAARPAEDLAALPGPWREALEALVAATRDSSQPWGCPDATVWVSVRGEEAWLAVTRPGGLALERRVESPGDLLPLGMALLARPSRTQRPPLAPAAGSPQARAGPGGAAVPKADRVRVEASASLSYAGLTEAMTAGAGLRGALPFGPWSATLWLRYYAVVSALGDAPVDFDLGELTIGAGAGYALLESPVRIDGGVFAGLAIVDMAVSAKDAQPGGEEPEEVESGVVDVRLGAEMRLAIPLVSPVRAVVAASAEISPASLASPGRRLDPVLPPLPGYGASLGLEAGIP